MKKHWYDYLWVLSLAYLVLGFFNILFAWLGLLCFFIPLIIAVAKGNKGYCNRTADGVSCFLCWEAPLACPGRRTYPNG